MASLEPCTRIQRQDSAPPPRAMQAFMQLSARNSQLTILQQRTVSCFKQGLECSIVTSPTPDELTRHAHNAGWIEAQVVRL